MENQTSVYCLTKGCVIKKNYLPLVKEPIRLITLTESNLFVGLLTELLRLSVDYIDNFVEKHYQSQ